ncbi:MAG: RNA-3-phosphate cyclase [Schwartzia sp. (in: firmicutes)]
MAAPDVVGRTKEEAERLLRTAGESFAEEMTRPTRHVFPVDDRCLYVVRQVLLADSRWRLTLAGKQRKEVSEDGL